MLERLDAFLLHLAKKILIGAGFFGIGIRPLVILHGLWWVFPWRNGVEANTFVIGAVLCAFFLFGMMMIIKQIEDQPEVLPHVGFFISLDKRLGPWLGFNALAFSECVVFSMEQSTSYVGWNCLILAAKIIVNWCFVPYLVIAYSQHPRCRHRLRVWLRWGVKTLRQALTPRRNPQPAPQPT